MAIERAARRTQEEYGGDDANRYLNKTCQDAIILNLQRACESSIDAAMLLGRVHRVGILQETREAYEMLEQVGRLGSSLAERLKRMVGFRTIAVHDYQKLNIDVVKAILVGRLDAFEAFTRLLLFQ